MTLQLPESTYRREQYTPDDRVFSRRLFQVHFAGGHLTLREMVRYRKMDFTAHWYTVYWSQWGLQMADYKTAREARDAMQEAIAAERGA